MDRLNKQWLAIVLCVFLSWPAVHAAESTQPEVIVHKDASCGCCSAWVEHLQASGFRVKVIDEGDMSAVKQRLGIPGKLGSCHTARVGGYLIEGHVPASSIRRLLREKPAIRGLAVPGMPIGSPGMEMKGRQDAYDVVAFDKTNATRVFESFP